MKIVVISGDDQEKARKRYFQIVSGVKKKNWEVVEIDQKRSLAEQLVSTGLFTADILYSIDGVKKLSPAEFMWLSKNAQKYEGSLLIYAPGKFPAPIKKLLPKSTKFETFDLPKLIWQFLDSFYPGNSVRCLALLEKLLENSPIELVIAMLARKLRDLYRFNSPKFTKEKLKDTIDELANIDYRSKTSDFDAKLGLEMIIVEKLG
jgi:hypothetical protein